MIFEYRFIGINQQGRMVQGIFSVNSLREAKKYLARLASQYKLNIKALERRRDFIYTVTLPGKRPVHKH